MSDINGWSAFGHWASLGPGFPTSASTKEHAQLRTTAAKMFAIKAPTRSRFTYSGRLVQFELERLANRAFVVEIGPFDAQKTSKTADLRGWLVLTSQGSQVQSLPRPPFILSQTRYLPEVRFAGCSGRLVQLPTSFASVRFRPIADISDPNFGILPLRRGPAIPAEHRLYFDDGAEQDDRQYAGHKSLVDGVVAARGYRKEVNWMTRNFPGQPHNENKLGIAGRDSASLPAPAAQESNAMTSLDPRIAAVTDRIIERSKLTRRGYLDLMAEQANRGITRPRLSCGNFAHWFAVAGQAKDDIRATRGPNPAVVTSFNDMLSAHQPCERYPAQIKIFARQVGATAQVAGGVPAMCDGVTQGQAGMDLSLFSRDVIALSTAVALSNGIFDGVAMLGICDKIVPGLLIGAPRFGHLQTLLNAREPAKAPPPATGTGRELFAFMRATADDAEHGGSAMLHAMEEML